MLIVSSFVHEVKFWQFFLLHRSTVFQVRTVQIRIKMRPYGYCGLRHSGYAAINCGEHGVA